MPFQVEIRKACAADRAQIRAMVVRAGLLPTGLDWRRFLVACADERVIGCVQLRRHRDCDELSSLVVAETHRRAGIASRLVQALLAQESGVTYLMCHEKLRSFYARFGYSEAEHQLPATLHRKRFLGRLFGLAVICMQRPAAALHT